MAKDFLTDVEVEQEIERLRESDFVKLARRELRLKYKRRQFLYQLRALEKRGKQLDADGITLDNLDTWVAEAEQEMGDSDDG